MRWAGVILANWRNCWTIELSWLEGGAKFADCGKLKEEIEDVAGMPEVAEVPGNEIDMAGSQLLLAPSNEHAKGRKQQKGSLFN
jgi:hypothetical protein